MATKSLLSPEAIADGAELALGHVQDLHKTGSFMPPRNNLVLDLKKILGIPMEDAFAFVQEMERTYSNELGQTAYKIPDAPRAG